jgi:tetratricopeptide (TPR) repeat protein
VQVSIDESVRFTSSVATLSACERFIYGAVQAPSAFAKLGFTTAGDDKYSQFARSELNSALGTVEMSNGNIKKARKLFGASLTEPNENALAQAEFAKPHVGIDVDLTTFNVARRYEANALNAYNNQIWEYAVAFGRHWADDQPFSTRPAVFVSFVSSSLLEEYETSIAVLKKALQVNPGSPQLINNLAFALASTDRVDEAEREMKRINWNGLPDLYRVTLTATQGLTLMRRGQLQAGTEYYRAAMALAQKIGMRSYESMAAALLAREQCLANDASADTTLKLAFEKAGKNPAPDVQKILANIVEQFERRAKRQQEEKRQEA